MMRGLAALLLCSISSLVSAAVVLQYHHISDASPASTSTSPDLFRQHMAYLNEHGFEVVPLTQLVAELEQGEREAESAKRVAITFDNGYSSVYSTAYPLLKQYGWPFTIFVNTKPIDDGWQEFVSWDQLRDMAQNGATIANHSHTHTHFSRIPQGESQQQWLQQVRTDVQTAQNRIEEELSQAPKLIAYPYGEYSQPVMALMADMGFVAFGQQSGALDPSQSLQALPRFPFGGHYGGMDEFGTKVGSRALVVDKVDVVNGNNTLPQLLPKQTQPQLRLTLAEPVSGIRCFATGQGALTTKLDSKELTITLNKALVAGRNRINCTAPGPQGRFYWYSQPLFLPKADGSWPAE